MCFVAWIHPDFKGGDDRILPLALKLNRGGNCIDFGGQGFNF